MDFALLLGAFERTHRERGWPRQRLLHECLRAAIRGGQLAPGTRLAATRVLAAELGLARNTVLEVYDQLLAEEIEERDLHYASVLRTRKLAVAALPPSVEAASEDAFDKKLADEVRLLMESDQIPELFFDLLDGLGKGMGVCQILWDTTVTPWVPKDYKWVDPRYLRPDAETLSEILLISDDAPQGKALEPYKFIIHLPRTKSGSIWRNGLTRLCAVMYMLKSFTVRDWWAFAEVFGIDRKSVV